MLNGPKFKKERDQLLMSNKLKDVLYETTVEANEAELEILEMKVAHGKEIFEKELENLKIAAGLDIAIIGEELRSEQQERLSLTGTHNSEIKSIKTEKGLRNVIELEYTNFLCMYTNCQKYELKGSVKIQHLSKEYYVRPRYV